MSPSLNKQTKYWRSQERRAKVCPYTWPFFEKKKLAKKKTWCVIPVCQWLSKSNCQMNRNRRNFFSVKWKKALSGSTLYANSFTSFFSNFFNLILISQKSVKLQSVFQNFFSYHCHTLAKIWKKKYYGPCENTHLIYMKLWFLTFTSCQPLIYLFNEVAQIFYQYIARMCINMISLRGGKLKMSMFFMCVLMMYKLYPAPTANCLMRNK